ncbi:MAG TPA: hypothetical protein VK909_06205 [Anaerolineales bacterium]|nr:hypothetical protein [Anaerolineales bacterium]
MVTFYSKQRAIAYIWMPLLLVGLSACKSASHCLVGGEITIPNNDNSAPTIVGIDFHMPDGSLVSRKPGDGLSNRITVPTNGDVTVIVAVQDDQGVKDAQLFAAAIDCSIDPSTGAESCSSPPLLSGPTASNPENNTAGEVGCTQRLVTQKINISKSSTGSNSVEISAKGINFSGQKVGSAIFTLSR